VFVAALLSAFAVLLGLSVLLGLLLTDGLLSIDGVRRADERAIDSLAAARTPFLTDASGIASDVGGATVLAAVAGTIAAVSAARRRWRVAAFAFFVLFVETAGYRLTLWMVPRRRPGVERLDDLPVGGSYPSGHTAASIAVYIGFALLLTSAFPTRRVRLAAWGLATVLAVLVALSRLYRGMHHPLDVAGGLFVGAGAICVLLFACRAAGVDTREARGARGGSLSEPGGGRWRRH
jgi:undecaprenyl-diphosphatase